MSYSHALHGKITFDPPMIRVELEDDRWQDVLWTLEFEREAVESITAVARITAVSACAIVPNKNHEYSGGAEEELQKIVSLLGTSRTFSGFLEAHYEIGLYGMGQCNMERIYVRDGEVATAAPELVWPEGVR